LNGSENTRILVVAALFAAFMAVGGLFALPLWGPVPLTLQVFFVLLAGLVLGPRFGALSVVLYLLLGLAAPVYAQGASGLSVIVGPTGGYLIGFVAAAALAGQLVRSSKIRTLVVAAVMGLVPIYALGSAWLAWQLHISDPRTALLVGVVPFVLLDLLKAFAAALLASTLISLQWVRGAPASIR
jgi:biotin transport system substrate-specific component